MEDESSQPEIEESTIEIPEEYGSLNSDFKQIAEVL